MDENINALKASFESFVTQLQICLDDAKKDKNK